ncbi:MAG: FtsW/RodA/SpoVE family cell cycle protein [Anaerolineales bacterium]|nr:FtsW/RodA/SpoVE family cell cycle protein [Anaerolineales bacterium]
MGQQSAMNSPQRLMGRAKEVQRTLRLSFDVPLILVTITLILYGLLMVYSTSWDVAMKMEQPATFFFTRQLLWLALGGGGAIFLAFFNYHYWQKLSILGMIATIALLLIVLLLNETTFGSARSLDSGSYRPAELAKLMIVLYLAVWMFAKGEQLSDVNFGLIPLAAILGVVGGLILSQPDLSAAGTIVILGGLMFFLAGGDSKQIAFLVIVALLTGAAVVSFHATGNERVGDFVAGLRNPLDSSDHVQHALAAFVRGGWFGLGIGLSSTKSASLPVPHTDSVFAVVGEETGVLGAVLIVILFSLFIWRGFAIAKRAPDGLGTLMAGGLTLWIGLEAFMNMTALTGLMPLAGNSLPFFSYGGSSLIFNLAAVGILLNISYQSEQKQQTEQRRSFSATVDLRRRDGRRRVSRPRRS